MHISASVQRNRQRSSGKSAVRGQAGAEPRPDLHVFTSGIKSPLSDTNLWPMYDIRLGWLHWVSGDCDASLFTKDQINTEIVELGNQTAQMQ